MVNVRLQFSFFARLQVGRGTLLLYILQFLLDSLNGFLARAVFSLHSRDIFLNLLRLAYGQLQVDNGDLCGSEILRGQGLATAADAIRSVALRKCENITF